MTTYMTVLKALLIAMLGLSLSGCDVVFISPLIDPKDAIADTRLVGRWSVPNSPLYEKGYIDIKQSGQKLIVASITSKNLKDKLMKEFYTSACDGKKFGSVAKNILAAITSGEKSSMTSISCVVRKFLQHYRMRISTTRGGLPTKDLAGPRRLWLTVRYITNYQLRDR